MLNRNFLLWLALCLLGVSLTQAQQPFATKRKSIGSTFQAQPSLTLQPARGAQTATSIPAPAAHRFSPIALTQPQQTDLRADIRGIGPEGPTFISLEMPQELSHLTRSPQTPLAQAQSVLTYLRTHGFTALPQEVSLMKHQVDDLGFTHIRLQQMAQGIPVYGADLWVHFTPDGKLIINGRYQREPDPTMLVPNLSEEDAVAAAKQHLSHHMELQELSPSIREQFDYETIPVELVVYPSRGRIRSQHLAYHVTLRPNIVHRHELFIDAKTGALLHDFDHTCSIQATGTAQDLNGVSRTIQVWNEGGTYYAIDASRPMYTGSNSSLPQAGQGAIYTLDVQNNNHQSDDAFYITTNNPNSWSPTAVSSHFNAGQSYTYFLNKFGRNAIDGNGGDIISYINVVDEQGQGLDNAYWNGAAMFYGNGNQGFFPLAASLDVGGHEMSHGVIQETANLVYQDQPGALNESFADIFGVMIDRDDWYLGDDVTRTSYIPTGRLRDMSDPHNGGNSLNDPGWQPKHMDEIYIGQQNNGGVHINSGIANYAFYLYATTVGKDDAEQVYYRALANYLTRSSEFIDCRLAVVQAATDLFGANSTQVTAAQSAYDQVGIFNGNGNQGPPDINPNPGTEYIVSTDYWTGDNGENLYILDVQAQSFISAFTLPAVPRTKISVRDDGGYGYYVGEDNNIYELGLDPNSTDYGSLAQLTSDNFWDNVAISKDGLRLAAVSTQVDTSIYVFNLGDPQVPGVKYRLYIPTTAQGGSNSEGVLYADALAWDAFGEYLMYDAFNELPSQTGNLQYWDINFLRAWNTTTNDFGDGQIIPLFSGLDPGVSVGNPVFSKNSPYIMAFEYLNANTGELSIYGANIETNEIGTISANNQYLGYPEFTIDDNAVLYNVGEPPAGGSVFAVSLASDKITGSGAGTQYISDALFGVSYATGDREISSVEEATASPELKAYPIPTQGDLHLAYRLPVAAEVRFTLSDLTGRTVEQRATRPQAAGMHSEHFDLSALPAGVYLLQMHSGEQVITRRVVRQ